MNTRYHRIRDTIGSDYIYTFVSSDDYVDTGDVSVFISLAHGALKYLYLDIYENKFWYTIRVVHRRMYRQMIQICDTFI